MAGRPAKGAIYVDDIRLQYRETGEVAADFERMLRSVRLWMLGAADTTVVTGLGLGPDLLKPVPFAMARRRAAAAHFVALLEPYGDAPPVRDFQAASSESFTVTGDTFDDRIGFDGAGVLRYIRRREGEIVRIAPAGAAALEDGFQTLVRLDTAAPVELNFSDGDTAVTVAGTGFATLRVHAPPGLSLTINGKAAGVHPGRRIDGLDAALTMARCAVSPVRCCIMGRHLTLDFRFVRRPEGGCVRSSAPPSAVLGAESRGRIQFSKG